MNLTQPTSSTTVAYIQRLLAKYDVEHGPNGQCFTTFSSEQVLTLLTQMDEAYEAMRAQRDKYLEMVQAWALEKIAHSDKPIPEPKLPVGDFDKFMEELEHEYAERI
jgi:hypothetical protein